MTLELRAQTEAPSVRLLQTAVSAGSAAVGETVRFGVVLENRSVATPITVTGVTPPSGEFSLAPDALGAPFPVGPGSKLLIPMLYAPQAFRRAVELPRAVRVRSDKSLAVRRESSMTRRRKDQETVSRNYIPRTGPLSRSR